MNIAKKILFGLLLSGFVFTAACGDEAAKAKAGEKCTAEKKCDEKLVCVGNAANATEGECKATCMPDSTTDCENAAATKCKAATNVVSDAGGSASDKVCDA